MKSLLKSWANGEFSKDPKYSLIPSLYSNLKVKVEVKEKICCPSLGIKNVYLDPKNGCLLRIISSYVCHKALICFNIRRL